MAFPDLHATAVSILTDGETVAADLEVSGTHQGPIVTPTGTIPATQRRMTMRGGRFVHVNAKGMITECRRYFDMAGLMQQLGLAD